MSSKPKNIKTPGPDHPITIERNRNRVVVKVANRVVADTRDALTLREAGYAPVFYIPRKDVDMALLQRTSTPRTVPIKATALISVFRTAASVRPMPSGRMRRPTRRWRPSTAIWPSTPIASTPSKNDLETPCRPCINPRGQSCPRCSSFVTRPHLPTQSARDRLHAWDEASFINGHILNVDAGKNH
jgi:uncharacterized protein (DUF427 family)